jgi:hypothetical protein
MIKWPQLLAAKREFQLHHLLAGTIYARLNGTLKNVVSVLV